MFNQHISRCLDLWKSLHQGVRERCLCNHINGIDDTPEKVAENVNSTQISDEPANVHDFVNTKIHSTDTYCKEENGKGIDIVSTMEVYNEKKEEVLIFATAVFESTSLQTLTQNEANFIERLIFRENHLKQNKANSGRVLDHM